MWKLFLLSFLSTVLSLPLQQNSLITLRTVLAPKAGGGNQPPPPTYGPLVLEEWNSSGLVQDWQVPCTLPGLSSETWTEGHLSPRYPWGDQVWFLCRNVPVNSSLATNPAPVRYMYLSEDGLLNTCVEDFVYANGTNVLNILPFSDMAQGINSFYLLGGGTTANGPTSPAKPAQPRIRVDSGLCAPADTEGALLQSSTGVTINQLRILNGTLYGTGLYGGSTGIPAPTIFQVGAVGLLPTGTRNPTTNIPGFPLVLSVWTDPFSDVWWRTGLNRTAYLARHDNADGSDLVFALPPSASAGTLGGASWSVATGRQEDSNFTIYLTNTSHIVKNTLNGLTSGLSYQPVLQAPPGWRYLSAHARSPNIPSPSPTSTPSATSTASSSASPTTSPSSSASSTSTSSSSSTSTPSPTSQPTTTSTPSPSASASAYPTSTSTATRNPNISPEPTPSNSPSPTQSISSSPSSTPSNGTIPFPPDNSQNQPDSLTLGDKTGIGLGSIAAFCLVGLAMFQFSPSLKNLWTRQFGSSVKSPKNGVSFRSPTPTDVTITINHNPQVLVQHRLEQLKDLQKQLSIKEVNTTQQTLDMDRRKKQFGPVIAGETV